MSTKYIVHQVIADDLSQVRIRYSTEENPDVVKLTSLVAILVKADVHQKEAEKQWQLRVKLYHEMWNRLRGDSNYDPCQVHNQLMLLGAAPDVRQRLTDLGVAAEAATEIEVLLLRRRVVALELALDTWMERDAKRPQPHPQPTNPNPTTELP